RLVPRGGRVADKMVLNVDVAPTILDLAGVSIPDDMHGVSWRPILERKRTRWRKAFLYEYYEYPAVHMVAKNRGVRTRRWKYIHYFEEPEAFELYDLKNDPEEVNNLYGDPKYEGKVDELRRLLTRLRQETHDPDL
ncbi:MAG: sulfatase/phosphatase domain-containing protein, partial [Armatimonadota bacterium]